VREWAVFSAITLVPALATGALGLRALRNEEVATEREVKQAASAEALRIRAAMDAELTAALAALPATMESERDPIARVAAVAPPFAAPLVIEAGQPLGAPGEVLQKVEASCAAVVEALASTRDKASREPLLRSLTGPCNDARSSAGRWLYPIVALEADEATPAIATWLSGHAARMTAAERTAFEFDVKRSTRSLADRRAILASLSNSAFAELPSLLREPEAATALAQGAGQAGMVSWKGSSSLGRLVPRGDRLAGFLVHQVSLETALRNGWPADRGAFSFDVVRGPAGTADPAHWARVAVANDLFLVVGPRDAGAVARRTQWSRLVLGVVALLATGLVFGVAAVLFSRERAARRSSALRTDLVSAVSHELRTPIASIRMLAELLQENRVEPGEEGEVHDALAAEARRLGDTVDRLLGFGRLEAGRYAANLASSSLAGSVALSIDVFEKRHPGLAAVERSLGDGVVVAHDPELVRLAVDNLLENARKYAPSGAPYRVSITEAPDRVTISVADRGPGIDRKHQRKIFEPFERVDDRLSRATEGTGIGLSLVRHAARVHGGEASVASEPGKGACFSFSISRSHEDQ
jgi:signal transduction histidine kinase